MQAMLRRLVGLLLILLVLAWSGQAQSQALIYGTDAVPTAPTVSLPTSTNSWFTNGNGTSIQGTQAPDYWFNKVGGELNSVLSTFYVTPSMTNRAQLATLLQAGFAGTLGGAPMPVIMDLNAASLGWSIYQSSSANSPSGGTPGVVDTVSSNGATGGSGFQILYQTAYDTAGDPTWLRQQVSGGGWSGWTRAAKINGDVTQIFAVAPAPSANFAVQLGQFVNATTGGFTLPALPYPIVVQFGYDSVLPGGGSATTYVKNFPTPFPHACVYISATIGTAFPGAVLGFSPLSASQYTAANGQAAGTGTAEGYTYMAVGY